MARPAYVIFGLPAESAEGHAQFTMKYGDGKEAELHLLKQPLVPESEHRDPQPALYELIDALEA